MKILKGGMHIETTGSQIDLVCGMELSQNNNYKFLYLKRIYYFCSKNCRKHFQNDPEKYIG